MPPPGGAPPQVPGGPPGGTGAAAAPGIMLGNQAQGTAKLQLALKALQDALSSLPFGSELHHEVLTALTKIGKHLPQGGMGAQDPGAVIQQLAGLARSTKAQPAQMAALSGLMGPGGGAPPPAPGGPAPEA